MMRHRGIAASRQARRDRQGSQRGTAGRRHRLMTHTGTKRRRHPDPQRATGVPTSDGREFRHRSTSVRSRHGANRPPHVRVPPRARSAVLLPFSRAGLCHSPRRLRRRPPRSIGTLQSFRRMAIGPKTRTRSSDANPASQVAHRKVHVSMIEGANCLCRDLLRQGRSAWCSRHEALPMPFKQKIVWNGWDEARSRVTGGNGRPVRLELSGVSANRNHSVAN